MSVESANKAAFDEVMGDPFVVPEKDGWYNTFKRRGAIGSQRYNLDEGHATANASRPSTLDFFCDVERVVTQIVGHNLLEKFVNTYVIGETDTDKILTQAERTEIEQRVGCALRGNGIAPVTKYFTVIRNGSVAHKC